MKSPFEMTASKPAASNGSPRRECGEIEVIADARERVQGLGRNRIEQLARIPNAKPERSSDGEVELGFLFPRDLPIMSQARDGEGTDVHQAG
jgi:hypothetical protein